MSESDKEIPVAPIKAFYSIDFSKLDEAVTNGLEYFIKLNNTERPVRGSQRELDFFKLIKNIETRESYKTIFDLYSISEHINNIELAIEE